jgi:Right handed beta helix region
VLKDLYIPYNVDVTASNVTIEDVRIVVSGNDFGVSLRHTRNVTISHCEISSPSAGSGRLMVGIKDIYADSSGTTVVGDNIWHTSTGVQMDSGLIEDSYIHDMGYASGDHLNGITSNASDGRPLIIRHNTVFNNFDQTDAIGLFEDFGAQVDRVIDHNLLAGGGYTLYAGANPGGQATSNIQVVDNRFARLYGARGGQFGPFTAYSRSGAGNQWSGNIWDNSGRTVS